MSELVYVIGSEEKGSPFKVGKSTEKALKNRIKTIQTGNPLSLKSFYEFTPKNGDAYALESKIRNDLINKFGYKKLTGEWIESSHKNSVEKIGNDISAILKDVDYDFKDDPRYKILKKENLELNNDLRNRYDDLYQEHKLIFQKLKEFNNLYNFIKDLHVQQKNLTTKISKYTKTIYRDITPDYEYEQILENQRGSWGEVHYNAMDWFISIYKMVTQKAYPDRHHRQGYNIFRLPEDGFIHITFNNTRYTYDIKTNSLSYVTPTQYEQPTRITGAITGRHYINKAEMYRLYDRKNNACHDQINLSVDDRFEQTKLRTCQITYNEKIYNFINEDFVEKGQVR